MAWRTTATNQSVGVQGGLGTSKGRFRRRIMAAAVSVATGSLALGVAPAAPAGAAPACQDRRLEVTLPLDPSETTYAVEGLLCAPGTRLPKTIQVLMAGATESGLAYWDFPHPDFYRAEPGTWGALRDRYSYVKYLADRGYASLTIDRIGTGKSDRPPAPLVTMESNAEVLHQVIQKLKDGSLGFGGFKRVILVGHSLGGPIAYIEAATHGDADGIIVQSFRHHQEPPFGRFATTLMPAQLDPSLAGAPPGYLTTQPNARAAFFFSAAADPVVVKHEEATKDTVTVGEVATFGPAFSLGASDRVKVPVLSIVGELDSLFCKPECPRSGEEAAAWDQAACFRSDVVPGGSHSMTLEPYNATRVFPLLIDWIEDNFGPGKKPCGSG